MVVLVVSDQKTTASIVKVNVYDSFWSGGKDDEVVIETQRGKLELDGGSIKH